MYLGRRQGYSPEQRQREQERWDATPTEAKIAMAVVPVGLFAFAKAMALLPGLKDAHMAEELSAAGSIMALLSLFFIQYTFRPVVQRRVEDKRRMSTSPVHTLIPDATGANPARGAGTKSTLWRLSLLGQDDPGFSERALCQFSPALLARVHGASNDDARRRLLPYVSRSAMSDVAKRLEGVQRVLPGAARVLDVEGTDLWTRITIEQPFLAASGSSIRRVPMRWVLRRSTAARSPAPIDLLAFTCPACGTPIEVTHPDGRCTTCDSAIAHGQLNWQVIEVSGPPQTPFFTPHEHCLESVHPSLEPATVEDYRLDAEIRSLLTRHPQIAAQTLERRAAEAAVAWFDALGSNSPAPPGGVLTKEVVAASRYEVGRIRAGRLSLQRGEAVVDQVEWARAGQDGWHETADFRVYLTLPWSMADAEGRVVDGNPDEDRTLSVYVRMIHPTAERVTLDGWQAWQIVDARAYGQ